MLAGIDASHFAEVVDRGGVGEHDIVVSVTAFVIGVVTFFGITEFAFLLLR